MREITIPYHLVIPTVFCLVTLLIIFLNRHNFFVTGKRKLLWTCITVFLFCYLIIVGCAAYEDLYFQWDLIKYDLDGDGMFGGEENTEAQKAAMDRLTNDTGRVFAVVTGFVFSGLISLTVLVLGKVYLFVSRQNKQENN